MPHILEIQTLVHGAPGPTKTISHPLPSTAWSADDLTHLLHGMSSLIRPDGARYVYAFTPAAYDGSKILVGSTPLDDGTGAAFYIVTVSVDEDDAVSDPVRLRIDAVQDIVARSSAHLAPGSSGTHGPS